MTDDLVRVNRKREERCFFFFFFRKSPFRSRCAGMGRWVETVYSVLYCREKTRARQFVLFALRPLKKLDEWIDDI